MARRVEVFTIHNPPDLSVPPTDEDFVVCPAVGSVDASTDVVLGSVIETCSIDPRHRVWLAPTSRPAVTSGWRIICGSCALILARIDG